jgi:serine/threonine protein kinase
MPNKIGRFEIISQAAKSPFATVYKAQDPESQQTIALKVVGLSQVLDRDSLVKTVFDEAERSKPLNSPNIALLYGVGDEDGQLLASAEYIQGNSVATTLARKDGFSIWDVQDIGRQVCHALDHAQVHKVVHHSLEPAKIMVQWDGLVKVLGFGISTLNSLAGSSAAIPEILHYVSPEELRGENCDQRSAIFALGAILYEMVSEQKPFQGDTADQVRAAILEATPTAPQELKSNISPALSALIMKAISKSPAARYQSGQELVKDLEGCNTAPKKTVTPVATKPKAAPVTNAATRLNLSGNSSSLSKAPAGAASAAAPAPAREKPASKPAFAVDPMMAADDEGTPAAAARKSFSDLEELPPLKDIFVPSVNSEPPAVVEEPPAEVAASKAVAAKKAKTEDKPKIQMRQAAERAVSEIRNTPPTLYLYALGGAILLVAMIIAGLMVYNLIEDHDSGSSDLASASAPTTPSKRAPKQIAPPPAPAPAPAPTQAQIVPPPPVETEPTPTVTEEPEKPVRGSRHRGKSPQAIATPRLADLTVVSTPSGAEITFDGSPLCQSPCTLTDIAPGQHTVTAAKAGYASASRGISLKGGASSSVSIQLTAELATLSISSTPSGASIVIDGQDTGKVTPMRFTVNKPGIHAVVLHRNGYLDADSSVNAQAGQTAYVNTTLTKLGETDDIRSAGGKFKKLLNRGQSASMGIVSIKTQPKGAQIMVNGRVLDRTSPFDFYLNPGTYVIDVTMSGYRSIHREINVEEGEKVAIEESLLPQ